MRNLVFVFSVALVPLVCLSSFAGDETHPRSVEEIRRTLADIFKETPDLPDPDIAERNQALRRLRAYRYLAEVPYADVKVDDELNLYAQAAARICDKLQRLDHKPENPGMPEEQYQIALKGTSHSNLYFGPGKIADSIDKYMDDSDAGNIAMLGHRRWCLNPAMGKVGFGKSGIYSAMWCFDQSNTKAPGFDFVCYPARGYMPLEFFKPSAAWSVSLNPARFKKSDNVMAKIYAWDKATKMKGEALELNHHNVDTRFFAVPFCVGFRPAASAVAPGKAYRVEIEGVTRIDDTPAAIGYVVEFVRLSN